MIISGSVSVSHRGYTVLFERDDGCWIGEIEGISDLVTVCADRFAEMEGEAKAAIDDYIETLTDLAVNETDS